MVPDMLPLNSQEIEERINALLFTLLNRKIVIFKSTLLTDESTRIVVRNVKTKATMKVDNLKEL